MLRYSFLWGLAALVAASPAHAWIAQKAGTAATSEQVLISKSNAALSNSGDRHIPVGYMGTGVLAETPFTVIPVAGSFTSLRVNVDTAPSGGATWDVTLKKNGSSTALTCQVTSATSGKCTGATGVSFAAGDYATVLVHPAGTPTASSVSASLIFSPTVANNTIIPAMGLGYSTTLTWAAPPFSSSTPGTPANRRFNVLPDDGTIDKFYVSSNAPGAGTSYAYTVDKNATTTALTCSIADAATTCSDTSTSPISVTGSSGSAAGDDLEFQAAPTNTPSSATAGVSVRYLPTTTGSFLLMMAGPNVNHATNTLYYPVAGGAGVAVGSTTEATVQAVSDSMTITKMAAKLTTAPGAGKSRLFTLRVNGADTALACTIADTDTACTDTGTIVVANDNLLSTSEVPSGSPATANPAVSYLANR